MINIKVFKPEVLSIKDDLLKSIHHFKSDSSIGYLNLPHSDRNWDASKKMGQLIKNNYDHLILVGIGGSSMGPRCIAELSFKKNISFLDNIDSIETENILDLIQSNLKIAWLFISKSGTTIEVLWTLDLILQKYKAQKTIQNLDLKFWAHTFFITELTHNTLHQLSIDHNRPCLEIPINVGGRFSVLSPVGIVITEFLDLNSDDFRKGSLTALSDDLNVVKISEQFLSSMDRAEIITLFWFYSSRLRWFGQWIQQLWAESLGKEYSKDNLKAFEFSTPMVAIGASDQHSILQQVIEGPKNKFVTIFRFKNIENSMTVITDPQFSQTLNMKGLSFGSLIKAETLATQKALDDHGISTALIEFENLNIETLGYLFMFFQMVVSTMADYKNINAYDQPAVEHGKKLIKAYLN